MESYLDQTQLNAHIQMCPTMRIFLQIFQLVRQLQRRLLVDLVAVVALTVGQLEWLAVSVQQSPSLLQQQVQIQHLLFVLVTVVVVESHLQQEMVAAQQVQIHVTVHITVAPVVMLEILVPLVVAVEVARLPTSKVQAEQLWVLLAAVVVVLVVQIMETTQSVIQMAQVVAETEHTQVVTEPE
jgi:hypothetical protein